MKSRIKEIIKETGKTQKEFAEEIGITLGGLNQHLSGNPSVEVLEKIANALEVPIWQLFTSPEEVKAKEEEGVITCPKCGQKFKEID